MCLLSYKNIETVIAYISEKLLSSFIVLKCNAAKEYFSHMKIKLHLYNSSQAK